LLETAVLLTFVRLWSALIVQRRLARLGRAAASAAEGDFDVVVKEADQAHPGDEISVVGRQLGRMIRSQRSRANRQAALDLLTEDAAKGLGLSALFNRAAELLSDGVGSDVAAVYEMFAPSGMLVLRAAIGDRELRPQLALMGPNQFHSRVLAADEALLGDSTAAALFGLDKRARRVAAIMIPGRHAPFGILMVASSDAAFSSEQLEFLQSVSHTVASAVNALHDPLTALPNRLLFEDRLDQAVKEGERTGDRVCLYFIDLDDFKEVNDSLGHQAGDQLLRRVADRLRKVLR